MPDQNQSSSNQLQEVKEDKEYIITKKFEDWVELFMDKTNKDTFGNATQSAMVAYGYEPHQYTTAAQVGHRNVKKVKNLGAMYADKQGASFGKLMDVALSRAFSEKNPAWWDRVMEVSGYKDQIIENNNTQVNVFNMGDEKVKSFNEKFKEFLIKGGE